MTACGSIQHIFGKPLPENPTLLDSLSSWKHKQSSVEETPSLTDIFGELHFKESPNSSPSILFNLNPQPPVFKSEKNDSTSNYVPTSQTTVYRHGESFSSMNSDSLSMCTEGLGFESSDDVEDYMNNDWRGSEGRKKGSISSETKRSRTSGGNFPPPISCIGKSGKPWVSFKPYRHNGRFILKEIRIPTQECLHACREDGRLKLQFIQSSDETIEEEEEEEAENEERSDDGCDYIYDRDHRNNEEDEYGERNFKIKNDEIRGKS